MTSSQSTELCGEGQGIASGGGSVTRGANEQMSALRPPNVEWMVGGRWTSPVFGWYFRMSNVKGQTVPSQPTTSNGETRGKRSTNTSSFLTRMREGPGRGSVNTG